MSDSVSASKSMMLLAVFAAVYGILFAPRRDPFLFRCERENEP